MIATIHTRFLKMAVGAAALVALSAWAGSNSALAAEVKSSQVANAADLEKLTVLLDGQHVRLRGAIYRYDGLRSIEAVNVDVKPEGSSPTIGQCRWDCSVRSASVDRRSGVANIEMSFRLKEGASPQTAVGIELSFDRWSPENYVVMPGAV